MTVIPPEPDDDPRVVPATEPPQEPSTDPDDVPGAPEDPDLPGAEPPMFPPDPDTPQRSSTDEEIEPSASPADLDGQSREAWPEDDADSALVPDGDRIVPTPPEQ